MTKDFMLQAIGALGAFLSVLAPIMIYVMSRKSQVKKLKTSSDVDIATVAEKQETAQDKLVGRLMDEATVHREDLRNIRAEVTRLLDRETRAQLDFARQLRDAHGENARMATRVAQLQTDLDITRRQLEDYQRYSSEVRRTRQME